MPLLLTSVQGPAPPDGPTADVCESITMPCFLLQKFLVVTTNYAARQLGVPKMVSITEALAK